MKFDKKRALELLEIIAGFPIDCFLKKTLDVVPVQEPGISEASDALFFDGSRL